MSFRTVHAQTAATETLLCSDDGDFSVASRQDFVKLDSILFWPAQKGGSSEPPSLQA